MKEWNVKKKTKISNAFFFLNSFSNINHFPVSFLHTQIFRPMIILIHSYSICINDVLFSLYDYSGAQQTKHSIYTAYIYASDTTNQKKAQHISWSTMSVYTVYRLCAYERDTVQWIKKKNNQILAILYDLYMYIKHQKISQYHVEHLLTKIVHWYIYIYAHI